MTKINYKVVYGLYKNLKMNKFDETRYYLRGVYIDKDGYTVTDGKIVVHIGDNIDIEEPIILKVEVLQNLAYKKGEDYAEIEDNKIKYLHSTIDNISLDAEYPEWKKILPDTTNEIINNFICFKLKDITRIADFLKNIYEIEIIQLAKHKCNHAINITIPESEQQKSGTFPTDYNIVLISYRE